MEDYAEHDDPTFLIRANENEQLVYHQTGEWLPDKRVDWRLMADAPLLLEEVKSLQRKLMLAESALGEIRAYHESGQGNLGEIIEHYQENEQVEMPSAFDED